MTKLSFRLFSFSTLLIVALGVIVAVIGLRVYDSYAIRQEKKQFEQVQTSINQLYSAIKAQVGEPDKFEQKNSCSQANLKYSQGPLVCDVSVVFVFGVDGSPTANSLIQNINAIVVTHSELFRSSQIPSPKLSPLIDLGNERYEERRSQNLLESRTNFSCAIVYHYAKPSESHFELTINTNKYNLFISLGCDAGARSRFYE